MCWASQSFWPLRDLRGEEAVEGLLETPGGVVGALPLLVVEGEEDGLLTAGLADGGDGLILLLLAGASIAVAVTSVLPAGLQVDDGLVADTLEDGDLVLDELTGLGGSDLGVEESVDVGTADVNKGAEGGGNVLALPDVQGLGNGDGALVAGAAGLDILDELSKGGRSADTVEDGLVASDKETDDVPVAHGVEVINLLLDVGVVDGALTAGLDKDTGNDLETLLDTGGDNGLQGIAVGAVDTDSLETGLLDLGNVRSDLVGGLAGTSVGVVGAVGETVVLSLANNDGLAAAGASGGSGGAGLGAGGSRGGGAGSRGGGAGGETRLGERADGNVVGLGGRHDNLGLGVGTRSNGGGRGVDDDGVGLAGSGVGTNGVGTGAGADVLGHADGAGGNAASGLDGSVRAGDGSLSGDDGGDTANGVSAGGDLGGGGAADGGGVSDSQRRGREGVSAGGRALLDLGGRDDDDGRDDAGRSRSDGDGRGVGRSRGDGLDSDGDNWVWESASIRGTGVL